MQRIVAFWNKGLVGKLTISLLGLVVVCCVLGAIFSSGGERQSGAQPTAPATPAPEPTPLPTESPVPTVPTATETPEQRYVRVAQEGVTILITRIELPKGEWSAKLMDLGRGPHVELTMPIGVGLSNEQTIRQGRRYLSQAVKALFDSDPALVSILIYGTLPDGPNQGEVNAMSILIERAAFERWDGTAENLGEWRIAPQYQ